MIQANELRIGNVIDRDFVIVELLRECSRIEFIDKEIIDRSFLVKYDGLKPTHLSKQILLRYGFNLNASQLYVVDDSRFAIHKPKDFDGYLSCWGGIVVGEIKHLHQLQNLYFALTGQELEVLL